MKYNPELHRRRSIRLKDYDYSQAGAYFVTICVWNKECLFGEVVDGEMRLNEWGQVVEFTWNDLPNHNENVMLDKFFVMPNHVHGIIVIVGADSKSAPVRAGLEPAPTTSRSNNKRHGLPEIVRQFKTFSARRINETRKNPCTPVWQRNYYEHIIRNEEELTQVREYIAGNPSRWGEDEYNPKTHAAGAGQ